MQALESKIGEDKGDEKKEAIVVEEDVRKEVEGLKQDVELLKEKVGIVFMDGISN